MDNYELALIILIGQYFYYGKVYDNNKKEGR